ncbi:anti-sigma factor C-terminal domain-containing protein [Natranaerobius thermophilus]|uniref:Sigma factor regulator C-terminal domain-containing protein n=1 Tax=Natranaerobius thermophilus (strain ATCC BAA-1301 / DSM 18059 / JW/NM-WN-LF) TaxID=457570 RepID=B2A0Y5_NATTJ|nr:anti-sigma factor C-terminal domain-containing protein [Natranaerobius thermophilus]ACB84608.1 conserved hypothetical protein [Natranaerobius thermophilus JW/NM-WN-LF]
MSFKHLLEKYKKGKATKDEIKLVEQELEKFEAIEDYYTENFLSLANSKDEEDKFDEKDNKKINSYEENNTIKETKNTLSMNINKLVNQRLRKVVFTAVIIVVILYTSIFFVLSPLVGMFFYNPSETSMGEDSPDIKFDFKALSELNVPGVNMAGINYVESEGFGNYSISYSKHDPFIDEMDSQTIKLKQGDFIGTLEGIGPSSHSFGFEVVKNPSLYEQGVYENQPEKMMEHLESLSPVSYVSVYLTFEEDMDLKEFAKMKLELEDLDIQWAGVRTHDDHNKDKSHGNNRNYLTGFNPNITGSISDARPNPDKYPLFQLVDATKEPRDSGPESWAEIYETHYRSLLKYMTDREDFIKALDYDPGKVEYYEHALNYIDKNGVNVFGVLVYGEAQELLEFAEEHDLLSLQLEQALPSRPNLQKPIE